MPPRRPGGRKNFKKEITISVDRLCFQEDLKGGVQNNLWIKLINKNYKNK